MFLLLLASLATGLTGCGGGEPAPSPESASVSPSPVREVESSVAGSPLSAQLPVDPAPPPADLEAFITTPQGPADPAFEAGLAEILALEADLEFSQAQARAQALLEGQERADRQRRRVQALLTRLREGKREMAGLSFALSRFDADDPAEAQAARAQLAAGGATGRLILRRLVGSADGPAALEAARLLRAGPGPADPGLSAAVLRRLAAEPSLPVRQGLLAILAEEAGSLDLADLAALQRFANAEGLMHREAVERIAAERLAQPITSEQAGRFFHLALNDDPAEQRHRLDLLLEIYRKVCRRDEQAFTRLMGDPQALSLLRAKAAAAAEGPDPRAAAWGRQAGAVLTSIDPAALAQGLAAWWRFDDPPAEGSAADAVADHSGLGHAAQPSGLGQEPWPKGVEGRAAAFDGRDSRVDAPADTDLNTLHHGSYSLSLWFRAEQLPPGRQPDMVSSLLVKPAQGWDLGLQLNRQGRLIFTHYLQGHRSVGVIAEVPVQLGRWHHAAAVVDQAQGVVQLYLDGQPQGSNVFDPGTPADDAQDAQPFRLGRAAAGNGPWASRFRGHIDEVRLYRRPLTPAEVMALHALHE